MQRRWKSIHHRQLLMLADCSLASTGRARARIASSFSVLGESERGHSFFKLNELLLTSHVSCFNIVTIAHATVRYVACVLCSTLFSRWTLILCSSHPHNKVDIVYRGDMDVPYRASLHVRNTRPFAVVRPLDPPHLLDDEVFRSELSHSVPLGGMSNLPPSVQEGLDAAIEAPMKQLNVASSTVHLNLIPVLRGLFDLFPESELTLLHKDEICRGLIAGMQDDGAEMRSIFDRVLADDSQYSAKEKSWLLTQLGIAHHKIAKVASMSADAVVSHQRSAEKFGEAIRFDENNAEAWRCWGCALDRISQQENDDNRRLELVRQSLEKYDRAIACDSTNAAVFDNKGRALRALGRDDDARAAFQRCVELAPNHVRAICSLGELQKKLNNFDEAQRYFERAIAVDPNDAVCIYKLGKNYQDHSRHLDKYSNEWRSALRSAIVEYKKCIEKDRNHLDAYADCGFCFTLLKQFNEARKWYIAGLKIDRNHQQLKRNLNKLNK